MIGIEAARKDLEDIAKPLSAEEAEGDEPAEARAGEASASAPPRAGATAPLRPERGRPVLLPRAAVLLARARRGHRRGGRGAGGRAARRGAEGWTARELGERVNCRLWGPGRYRRALAMALARGAIRHTGRGRYAAEQEALSSKN